MDVKSPWYQKVLSEIRNLDARKKEMEKHFSWEIREDYDELVKKETVEAVDLLKFGADNRVEGDNVVISVEGEEFSIPKDILSNELGSDQYNLLVNNAEEASKDEPFPEEESKEPEQDDTKPDTPHPSTEITLPDGRKIPSEMAPMFLFAQAMEKAIFTLTGINASDTVVAPPVKVKSKTTGELLRNIADLQQQVLALEDEKEKALAGDGSELNKLREDKEAAVQRIAALKEEIRQQKSTYESNIERLKKESEEKIKERIESELKGRVESATKVVQDNILKQKEMQISSLETDYHVKLDSLKNDYESKISSLKNDYEAKVKELSNKTNEEASKASSMAEDNKRALEQAKEDYESKLSAVNEEHNKKLERIKKENEERIAAINKENEEHKKMLDTIKQENNSLKDQLSDLRDDMSTDFLTGVKNDRALNDDYKRFTPKLAARVLILGMKAINEQGLDVGNAIISATANALSDSFGGRVYRTMGDQFVVFPKGSADEVRDKLEEIAGDLEEHDVSLAYGVGEGKSAYKDATAAANEMRAEIYSQTEEDDSYDSEDESDTDPSDADQSDADMPDTSPDADLFDTEESDTDDENDEDDEDERLAETLMEGEDL